MNKVTKKKRDIVFSSKKNDCMIKVHSDYARRYAKLLEGDDSVKCYKTDILLDKTTLQSLSTIRIRKSYMDALWNSDFYIEFVDGSKGVREVVSIGALEQLAIVEQLELSRRYWTKMNITNWKVVQVREVKNNVY